LLELMDGRIACGCSDGHVYIYSEYQLQKKLSGHQEFVTTIIQQQNGFLVSASDSLIRIYDQNEECIRILKDKEFTANSLCALKKGGFASSSHGDYIKLWNETGDCVDKISCRSVIYAVVELRDGTIASCSTKKLLILEKNGCIVQELDYGLYDSLSLLELKEGLLVTGACDEKIRIWRNNAMRLVRVGMVDVHFEFV
jgi:WD40 repeat protein